MTEQLLIAKWKAEELTFKSKHAIRWHIGEFTAKRWCARMDYRAGGLYDSDSRARRWFTLVKIMITGAW